MLNEFIEQQKMWNFEGPTGVKNFAKICRALGYEDDNFGKFEINASFGDIIEFLRDNSGAIEALINWIRKNMNQDWKDNLETYLPEKEEEDDEE